MTEPTQQPAGQPTPTTAALITDFRIMRSTEIAPGWWGQPREVGETPSGTVADSFCREQNAVTMDVNRSKRIEYYADPITATAALPRQAVASA